MGKVLGSRFLIYKGCSWGREREAVSNRVSLATEGMAEMVSLRSAGDIMDQTGMRNELFLRSHRVTIVLLT